LSGVAGKLQMRALVVLRMAQCQLPPIINEHQPLHIDAPAADAPASRSNARAAWRAARVGLPLLQGLGQSSVTWRGIMKFIRLYSGPSTLNGAVIYGFFVEGVLRGAAELRLLARAGEAEAALSIERAWQSRGVGTALLERVLLAARNRKIEHLA
jgi:hypothetical protein